MEIFNSTTELKEFSKNLHLLVLPSTLWAAHIDPEYNFIAILHIQIKSLLKLTVDKGIVLTFDSTQNLINTSFFIQNEVVCIPELSNCIKAVSDLSRVICILHNLKLCSNADKNGDYPHCNKYVGFNDYNALCQRCHWSDKEDRDNNPLLKDFNKLQLHCNNPILPEDTALDNAVEENSLCCVENSHEDISHKFDKEYSTEDDLITLDSKEVQFDDTVFPENDGKELRDLKTSKHRRNSRSFPCEFCKKAFFTKTHLREHLRSHTGEKPFLCGICNKASSRKSVHQRHVLTHSNVKPNLCNVCGKTFCQGYRMKDHLLTHSSERPFECEICHKGFTKSYSLKLHQKTHSGIRPFICSTCGKTYTTQSNLSTHVRSTHTNKKPHTCANCHMSFVHPRHLRIHMRKHTGEKPYKCMICGKTFSKNIHLTIHTRTHTGEKPHICDICGKGFTTTGNLSSHKKVHHKDSHASAS